MRYYIFSVCALIFLWLLIDRPKQQETSQVSSGLLSEQISLLWQTATDKHRRKLKAQSRTLPVAQNEYRRRYGIEPPAGFDKWFEFAKQRDSPIIDDYDELMEDLRPWRAYQASECDLRGGQLSLKNDILDICIFDGNLTVPEDTSAYNLKAHVNPFRHLIKDFSHNLPNLCMKYNLNDQSRSILPPEARRQVPPGLSKTECPGDFKIEWRNFKHKNDWEAITLHCDAHSPAKGGSQTTRFGPLANSWEEVTDLCSYSDAPPHGIIPSPDTQEITDAAIPIMSAGRLSTFNDILFPTFWRLRWNMINYPDSSLFEQKRDVVGWRGTSTGGYAETVEDWRHFQRHRMVQLAHGFPIGDSRQSLVWPSARLLKRLNVHFTGILSCSEAACDDMQRKVPPTDYEELAETFKNKIMLDMDGHGLSGRFYQLLHSNSAVLKQGLMREWHDDRLVPWLHYIPLSMEMLELEGLLEFLFGDGKLILGNIAAEGRRWANVALRTEDMQIYTYRLLLEMGRRSF